MLFCKNSMMAVILAEEFIKPYMMLIMFHIMCQIFLDTKIFNTFITRQNTKGPYLKSRHGLSLNQMIIMQWPTIVNILPMISLTNFVEAIKIMKVMAIMIMQGFEDKTNKYSFSFSQKLLAIKFKVILWRENFFYTYLRKLKIFK